MVFFEARKKKDLYLWMSKAPDGPSVKFLATNGTHRAFPESLQAGNAVVAELHDLDLRQAEI